MCKSWEMQSREVNKKVHGKVDLEKEVAFENFELYLPSCMIFQSCFVQDWLGQVCVWVK